MVSGAKVRIRRARVGDVAQMHEVINEYALEGLMLPKSKADLYEGIRDFFVADASGQVMGCAALHVMWDDLAEVRSVAVRKDRRLTGIGARLIRACLKEAQTLGLGRVFLLTCEPKFFERFQFRTVDKEELPRKIWSDCLKCVRFADCNEIAMVRDLAGSER